MTKKMRIAIFTDVFLPQINGVVTATLSLAKGLADKGHKVYIVAPSYEIDKEFSYKNIKVKRISSIPAFFYEDFKIASPINFELVAYLKKNKIELIHFQVPMTVGMHAIILSKYLNLPIVGTFHTFFADPEYLKHIKITNSFVQKLAWKYSNFFYNKCDIITCPSEVTKKEIEAQNVKPEIRVVSNGIDASIFDNSKSKTIKAKYNKKGKLLLYVGRIAHEKNIVYLLECMKKVFQEENSAKLLIVGGGPQFKEVKEKIKKLNITNNVILLGKIDHSDLVKSGIFGACDIFVTASKTETQGITMLEAQANGIVCVCVAEKATVELIENGVNGFLVKDKDKKEFSNSVLKLLRNKKTYELLRKNTLETIKKHDIKYIINEWEEIYSELINRKQF
ncbi:MAG: glycosyltransferase [Candidatus Woesearchaeota archaeon]|jgi:glycosyltransferase involved in cell wall biosynthesis